MKAEAYLLLPLAAAFLYAIAILFLKRSIGKGVGVWRTAFVFNWMMTLIFIPFFFLGEVHPSWFGLGVAVLAAFFFFLGQVGTFAAMNTGDVSLATPVMGSKIILVAIFLQVFLGEHLGVKLWVGAFLATVSIAMLQLGSGGKVRHVGKTILFALFSAISFAATDIVVQKFTPEVGFHFMIPVMYLFVGIFSFSMMPFFHAPLRDISRDAWKWLAPGALILAVQAIGTTAAIGMFAHATEINIVYSTRGLWSVLMVWIVGHWFSNHEGKAGPVVMFSRLAGAILLLSAVVMVLI